MPGVQMGAASIDDVLDYAHDETLGQHLIDCKRRT